MPLQGPPIDTRTFEELHKEALSRIPRYAPEWTDFNESDPGTAMVQLFAWFTELMLFQLNRVPMRNYVEFLKLLNFSPAPARPAQTDVSLTPVLAEVPVTVPERSRILATPPGSQPVEFETTRPLVVVPWPLKWVLTEIGGQFEDVTTINNSKDTPFYPFGHFPRVNNAFYLGFEAPADSQGDPRKAVAFPSEISIRFYTPPENRPLDEPVRGPVLVWEYQSRSDPERWRPLITINTNTPTNRDDTNKLTQDGYMRIPGPRDAIMSRLRDLEGFWIRCRLAQTGYPGSSRPKLDFFRVNTVPVEHLVSVTDEVLGISEGRSESSLPGDQPPLYQLSNRPVAPDSLVVSIEREGQEPEIWQRVEHFLLSGPESRHYTLESGTGIVRFGDGTHGRIPEAGTEIVAQRYRFGGGTIGNVPAGSIASPPNGVVGIDKAVNERRAVNGADEENVEELKRNAPKILRSRGRAVTQNDFESLAEESPEVAQAVALANHHPDFRETKIIGSITVYIVPNRRITAPAQRPIPGKELLDAVRKRLDKVRLITSELHVAKPEFVDVDIRVRLIPSDSYSLEEAIDGVSKALREALAPVPNHRVAEEDEPDENTGEQEPTAFWKFRQQLYPSSLFEIITDTGQNDIRGPMVRAVTELALRVACGNGRTKELRLDDVVELQPWELPWIRTLEVLGHDPDVRRASACEEAEQWQT